MKRRAYTLKTCNDVPFGIYPPYPQGPAIVQNDGWQTSTITGEHIEGAIVGAFKVISMHPYHSERHELDGKTFPTPEEANRAKFEAGLIAYMVYDDSEWANYKAMKLTPVREYVWTDDYSFLRELTCKNHPTARYLTKNPWHRSLHLVKRPEGEIERSETGECVCPFDDLAVVEPREEKVVEKGDPDAVKIVIYLSLLRHQPGRYTRTAFGRWYECVGPDGHKFTNSSIVSLRGALKGRYGKFEETVVDLRPDPRA